MRKLLLLAVLLVIPSIVAASEKVYSPSELIDKITQDKTLDGQKIILEGEAICEPIERKDGCWINVTDGSMAIGVFFKDKTQTDKIKIWGQYHFKGDIVRIEGTVYLADKQTGGELDIQGENLTVVSQGYRVDEVIPLWKIIAGIILGLITLWLIGERIYTYFRNKRSKKTNVIEGFFDPNKDS
ncbi:MAG: hypothetical protein HGA95_00895 [Caldiserica bacterium]|nr:hypothetical protein [Caldisericota bacterium]